MRDLFTSDSFCNIDYQLSKQQPLPMLLFPFENDVSQPNFLK